MNKTLIYEMWPVQVNGLVEKTKQLERIKELETTHVWLRTNKLVKEPYNNIAEAINIEKLYGNKNEFVKFVEDAHSQGLKVIIDLDVNVSADNLEEYDNQIRAIRNISTVWILGYKIDGFYLNAKELYTPHIVNVLEDSFLKPFGLNEIRPFLVVGCTDPSYDYAFGILEKAPIDLIDDCFLKEQAEEKGLNAIAYSISKDRRLPKTAVSLETYGSERISKVLGESPRKVAEALFMNGPDNIILYQGQELGEKDVNMNWINDYDNQYRDKNSPLTWYLLYIRIWKNNQPR